MGRGSHDCRLSHTEVALVQWARRVEWLRLLCQVGDLLRGTSLAFTTDAKEVLFRDVVSVQGFVDAA